MLELKLNHVSERGSWYFLISCWFWTLLTLLPKPRLLSGINGDYCSDVTANAGLTHWGWDKMAAVLQTTFSNAFCWMKMYEFRLKFHWSLFPSVQLTILHHWFRWWLGADQSISHYLNQWWLDYQCIYVSLGLNELSGVATVNRGRQG